ncbi:uncharacterized protein B0T15DRAFT_188878 [Chaetomium strumarium]|uniref:Uncharacterized protein n=1 Tax=Chaetomium strumarium TaxID=1170767 RepID=A0AAJ0GSK4_9PEZI|nr:hypothetical protein B0T15DRAFT_188878 [Chaetomium strumarium]
MDSSTATSPYPPPGQVTAAARAVALSLGEELHYAIVGGAACLMLGSARLTADVDFVVPKGRTKNARRLLRNQPDRFTVESRANHTYYRTQSQRHTSHSLGDECLRR